MPKPPADTIGRLLNWSYANLAMTHAAHEEGRSKCKVQHFMIRAKLYKGLNTGTMHTGSLMDEERLKMVLPKACAYCGMAVKLTLDHLIPTARGGPDIADNSVWACRSCNSSKGAKDLLTWWSLTHGEPIPLLLVRRHLKLCMEIVRARGLNDVALSESPELPFDVESIISGFPRPNECRLWVVGL